MNRVALYARTSTADRQDPETQLLALRQFAAARGWTVTTEYVDQISGAKETRPALGRLERDAKARRFDILLVYRLDRVSRSLRHLVLLLDQFRALSIAFVSLAEGIDLTTPAGRLQMQILGSIAEYEREVIRDRVRLGLARAKAQGVKLGRRRVRVPQAQIDAVRDLSVRAAAKKLGISHGKAQALLKAARTKNPPGVVSEIPKENVDPDPL